MPTQPSRPGGSMDGTVPVTAGVWWRSFLLFIASFGATIYFCLLRVATEGGRPFRVAVSRRGKCRPSEKFIVLKLPALPLGLTVPCRRWSRFRDPDVGGMQGDRGDERAGDELKRLVGCRVGIDVPDTEVQARHRVDPGQAERLAASVFCERVSTESPSARVTDPVANRRRRRRSAARQGCQVPVRLRSSG